jgi:hypothetical protein
LIFRPFSVAVYLGLENADEGKISVLFVVIKAEADHELIGDLASGIIGDEVDLAAGGLIEQSAGTHAVCSLELKVFFQVCKGLSAIDNILDDDNIGVGKIVAVSVLRAEKT